VAIERELKLDAGPEFQLPDLAEIDGLHPGSLVQTRLESTYWDTPDLRLTRWGFGLRYRAPEGWTLKLPRPSQGRTLVRTEIVVVGSPRSVPDDLIRLLGAYLRGARLKPVARVATMRRTLPLLDGTGTERAELVDDRVSILDQGRVTGRFRELEIELRPGLAEVPEPLIDRLCQAGATLAEPSSKLIRALGPQARQPPELEEVTLGRKDRASRVLQVGLAMATRRLLEHDLGIRLGKAPDDIHQARVATRRLRSLLRTFRPLLDPERSTWLRKELGWLGQELGKVRDREVMQERLTGLAGRLTEAQRAGLDTLFERIHTEIESARASLLLSLEGKRYQRLLEALIAAAKQPPMADQSATQRTVLKLVRGSCQRLRRAISRLGSNPSDSAVHHSRILAKRARYATELVAPLVGKRARRFAAVAASLQGTLGELRDSASAQGWLETNSRNGPISPNAAYLAGLLSGLESARFEQARAQVKPVFNSIRRLRSPTR
jgi:CHAD domain-containing protein